MSHDPSSERPSNRSTAPVVRIARTVSPFVSCIVLTRRVDEQRDSFVVWGFVPLIGPFGPFVQFGHLSESQKSAGFYTLLSGEAIMQIGGLVYLIQALLGADVSEPVQVGWRVGPSLSPSRTGFVLDGRF